MRNPFPLTVKSLILFEDSYKFFEPFPRRPVPVWWENLVDPSEGLGAVLASKSLVLQHLAISFMINAEEIFRQCQPAWLWSNLQSLALTSQLMQDDPGKREEIRTLLSRSAVIARQMPRIHTFVLWNGGKAHACAFIYCVDEDQASITWRGTWNLDLSGMTKSWQLTASKRTFAKLQVKQECISSVVTSHGDSIHHLKLPCQVIHPASLWQMRREGFSLAQ
jgi:hypothetical protein